jgi:hypothetical protein
MLKQLKQCVSKISEDCKFSHQAGRFRTALVSWLGTRNSVGNAACQGKLLPDVGEGLDDEDRRAFGLVVSITLRPLAVDAIWRIYLVDIFSSVPGTEGLVTGACA